MGSRSIRVGILPNQPRLKTQVIRRVVDSQKTVVVTVGQLFVDFGFEFFDDLVGIHVRVGEFVL
jgi:hypothetical protein